jgi:membrane protease YdiL (CAAX protease family)
MERFSSLLNSRIGALLVLVLCIGLIYNPWTKFPLTFIVIIIAVLAFTYFQDKSLNALQFKKLTLKDIGIVVALYIVLELVMDILVQPAINLIFPEPVDYSAFASLKGNTPKFIKYLCYMWISAAIGEELLFRAFAFAQLGKIIGKRKGVIVVLSAVLFSIPHLYQGSAGLAITFLFGLAFGIIYMRFKNIGINILVHGLIDTLFLTLAYLDMLSFYG